MKCEEAESYIMKYMDGEITKEEAKILNEHLLDCAFCKESFFIYDKMQEELKSMPLYEAPENFELEVMTKIVQISENEYEIQYSLSHKIWGVIWGTFTVIFGTGTILAFYREPIMMSLAENPYFADKIKNLMPIADEITKQGETIKTVFDDTVFTINTILSNSVGIIFAILTFVCAIQFYLLHHRKKNSKVDGK